MLGLFSKKDLVLVCAIIVLIISLIFVWNYAQNQRDEKSRYRNNYNTLKDGLTYYETKDGQIYGKAGVLELKMSEISDSIKKELKEFDVKLKNVKTIIQNQVNTTNEFKTFVKDSILFDSTHIQFASWQDPYTEFSMIVKNDSAYVKYSTTLDLLQVVYKEPRGWNIFSKKFWSKRHLSQMITTPNPNAKINYANVIQIQKKD